MSRFRPKNGKKYVLCWHCGKPLLPGFVSLRLNDTDLKVHVACKIDALNLLQRNEVTFAGEPLKPRHKSKRPDY